MAEQAFDLLVIGGGIHGAAVARDASGRGLIVMLAEKGDYASATSSASSKLIHGGLRYLEQLELKLVRESLLERANLLKTAPHLVEKLRFLMPVYNWQRRPGLLIQAGLALYDLLSIGDGLPVSGRLSSQDVVNLPRLRHRKPQLCPPLLRLRGRRCAAHPLSATRCPRPWRRYFEPPRGDRDRPSRQRLCGRDRRSRHKAQHRGALCRQRSGSLGRQGRCVMCKATACASSTIGAR